MSTRVETPAKRSIDFFERQFRRQTEAGDYALNPFERRVLKEAFLQARSLQSRLALDYQV